ncbi:MAG: hypothetical protein KJP07_15835, partial [Desulfatitalea sp.]|nr:hypothetical protein [Desulfatitalea sp.]
MSSSKSEATKRRVGEFRLPEIKTPADVEAMSHLSKEEKELGIKNLKKIPESDGWAIMGNDPELQVFWHIMEREYTALLQGDFQGVPFGPMNLLSLVAAKKSGSDYLYNFFAALTVRQIEAYPQSPDNAAKLAVLDSPDSELWRDEERMILKFAWASINNEMTDELFEEAREAWGEQRLLRNLAWLSYVSMWSMVANVLDIKFLPEQMLPPGFTIPAQAIEAAMP